MSAAKGKAQAQEPVRISLMDRFEAHKKTVVGIAALLVIVVVGVILYTTFHSKAREERWTDLVSTVLHNPFSAGPTLDRLEQRGGSDILPHILLQRAIRNSLAKSYDLALADLNRLQQDYRDHYLNTLPATERHSLVDELRRQVESEKQWQATHTYTSPAVDTKRVGLVETSLGAFWVGFFPELAPEHVNHFVSQAMAGVYNGTSVTRLTASRFDFGGEASRDEDPFNDESGLLEQPLTPEASRLKVRHERGMVSSLEIEGGESPTRLTVAIQEDIELDKRQTIFGRVLTDRYPNLSTLDAIGKAVTYGNSTDAAHKDTAKFGPVADHPVEPVRILRVSIWSGGRIEEGHQWDTAAVVKPEPPAAPPPAGTSGDEPADGKPVEDEPADSPKEATPPADGPADPPGSEKEPG